MPSCQQPAAIQRPAVTQHWPRSPLVHHLHRLPGILLLPFCPLFIKVRNKIKLEPSLIHVDPGVQCHLWQIFTSEWLHHHPDTSHSDGPHHLPDPAAGAGLRPAHGHSPETHRAWRQSESWHVLSSKHRTPRALLWWEHNREERDLNGSRNSTFFMFLFWCTAQDLGFFKSKFLVFCNLLNYFSIWLFITH